MKIRSPSLVELHAFLAVSRLRSFRLAAEELCVTQAAVSRAVQRLEQHLGDCQLFERSSQGVALTDVQDAAVHADPRTTRRYDRARHRLDAAPTYTLAAALAE